jgi:MATE family multidrug resistance protein
MFPSPPVRQEIVAAVRLAAPVVVVQLGLMLMGVVDTMMLGHYSPQALAAAGVGHIFCAVVQMLGYGVLSALDPLLSQAHGAGDRPAMGAHLQRGIVLAAILTLPLSLVMWDIRWFLRLTHQQPMVVDSAALFVRATAWGNLPFLLFAAFRLTLQAMSIVRPAAMTILIGNGLNIAGNYLLIYGHFGFPALGVVGSGYSTAFARWVCCAYLILASRRHIAPFWRGFTAEATAWRNHARLLRIGLPIGLHNSLELCTFLTVALLMGQMGVAALGGHQIALNLSALSFMVPLGIGGAAATRVGNAIGRQDMAAARRSAAVCLGLGAGVMSLFALLFATAPHLLATLYTADPAVVAMAVALIPIAAAFQIFDGVQVVSAGILRGSADTTYPAAVALVGFWLLGLPGGWYLAFREDMGARGLWWGLTLGLGAVAVLFVVRIAARFRSHIGRELG